MQTTAGTRKGERKGPPATVKGAVEGRTVTYKYAKNVVVVTCGGAFGF